MRWVPLVVILALVGSDAVAEPVSLEERLTAGEAAYQADQLEDARTLCQWPTPVADPRQRARLKLCQAMALNDRRDLCLTRFEEAMTAAEAAEDAELTFRIMSRHARYLLSVGELDAGEALARRLLDATEQMPRSVARAEAWGVLGAAAIYRDDLSAAYVAYGRARDAAPDDAPLLRAKSLDGQIIVLRRAGADERAFEMAYAGLDAYRAVGSTYGEVRMYQALAAASAALEDPDAVVAYRLTAWRLAEAAGVSESWQVLANLLNDQMVSGDVTRALETWRQLQPGLDFLEVEPRQIARAVAGQALAASGRFDALERLYAELAFEGAHGVRGVAMLADLKARLLREAGQLRAAADELAPALEALEEALLVVPAAAVGHHAEWLLSYELLLELYAELEDADALARLMTRIKARVFVARVAGAARDIEAALQVPAPVAAHPAEAMPHGRALLDLYLAERGAIGILQVEQQRHVIRWPYGRAWFALMSHKLTEAILTFGAWRPPARVLGEILFEPLLPHLDGVEALDIVPHGPLSATAWPALIIDGEVLIDRFVLRHLPSSAALIGEARADEPIDWDKVSGVALVDPLGDLPWTRAEADALKGALGGRILDFDAATVEATLTALQQADVVHLGVHGRLNTEGRVGLEMASDRVGGRVRLDPDDLLGVEVRAWLVNLAGCGTGGGVHTLGGEVLGSVERTLLVAGADQVVSSIWPVDDQATAKLMTHFYLALPALGPEGALAAAARALRWAGADEPGNQHAAHLSHPMFWAGIRIMGRHQGR